MTWTGDFLVRAQFGRGAEKFGGNGVGISAIEIFKLLLVDGTKSSGGSKERIASSACRERK